MALRSIEESWQHFASCCFDANNPPPKTQIIEMRKAFYAGASSVVADCHEISQPHISEDEGADHIDYITHEVEAFAREMLRQADEMN